MTKGLIDSKLEITKVPNKLRLDGDWIMGANSAEEGDDVIGRKMIVEDHLV